MQFQEVVGRALEIRAKFAAFEKAQYGKEWTNEQLMQGFVVDVGELTKLSMAKSGVREVENLDERLAHELADCLWSVIVLADKYQINLESAFEQTMNQLDSTLSSLQASGGLSDGRAEEKDNTSSS